MTKVLGIDTGTNSLGWAIVEKNGETRSLIDKGVEIFQEGVKIEKGIESSKAAERTAHRSLRKRYYRIKLRKIRLLTILSENNLCPPLSKKELSDWRLKKIYPQNELFMKWQKTDDVRGINPYYFRHKCLNEKLDLSDLSQRYILGRALYHIVQRRGFLSNRKNQSSDVDGKVKTGISELTAEMTQAGYNYLGDYFYSLYQRGDKIRKRYTARNEHYHNEFMAICQKQGLQEELVARLDKAIFSYRSSPKSQKDMVGKCTFETNKTRCPKSHPLFEEFCMLQVINNIKIKTPEDDALRPLNDVERKLATSQFLRKSSPNFKFEDIAKKIAGKGKYGNYKKNPYQAYLFNYEMEQTFSGCPVTAQLISLFGEDWKRGICEVYIYKPNKKEKTETDIINDVWHALSFYSDPNELAKFAKNHLQMNEKDAKAFADISVPEGYAALSLKAIRKILPFLRKGLIYSHATFLANLDAVMPACVWEDKQRREIAMEEIIKVMEDYNTRTDAGTLEACVKGYIRDIYGVSEITLKKLYHPSMMDTYPRQSPNLNGIYQLGSPRTNSVRNPMAMRAMFRLRKLINRLLIEGKINQDTVINIEFARELNDANKRKAIAEYNRQNEKEREIARKKIETDAKIIPTDNDILKYQLWVEQNHICPYTRKTIGITEFLGPNPSYDIEHTIPKSVGGDSTKMNLTLCESKFNRDVKKNKLPSQLANAEEILQTISKWKDNYEDLDKRIHKLRRGNEATKEAKDKRIQKRHLLILQRDYWKGKYERFVMTEVPEGFSRRQGTDISVISRYARLYLKSVFKHVYTVRGIATADFRKMWGLQEEFEKKQRTNHVHHCIDAVVIACIDKQFYDKLARYYHEYGEYECGQKKKPTFPMPWEHFVRDIKKIQDEILVSHYTPDNMPKQGRRYIKTKNRKLLAKGDAARASLHNDTYYGAIAEPGTQNIKYVVRKSLSDIKESDIKNIVDDRVRDIVEAAVADKGFARAMAEPLWINQGLGITIKKVRCYTPDVTEPILIRHHRDVSRKEYKRQEHVKVDRNYLMAVYEGRDKRDMKKRKFILLTSIAAATYFKTSNDKQAVGHNIVPLLSEEGFQLAFILKIGTMVLFYENDPNEVWGSEVKRLYKVTELWKSGIVVLTYHQEARQGTEVKNEIVPCFSAIAPAAKLRLSVSRINALIEGYDFRINEIGEIQRLR